MLCWYVILLLQRDALCTEMMLCFIHRKYNIYYEADFVLWKSTGCRDTEVCLGIFLKHALHISFFVDNNDIIPLPSARQHPSYGDCLEVKREYYQNSSVPDCVTQCSQSAAHLCEQFLQSNRLGLSHWDPYVVRRGGCLELYYCNMVEWFWWDSSLIFDVL